MSELIQAINNAASWTDYYEAHKHAYQAVLESQWALGRCSFAQQLHHTATPDVSGTTAGILNWAAYSQPSAETLHAFVPVFRSLLESEPHRVRSNRYLFFVTIGKALPASTIRESLGEIGTRVDFWSGSLADVLETPPIQASLEGANALIDCHLDEGASLQNSLDSSFRAMRDIVRKRHSGTESVAPQSIKLPLLDSSFILSSYRSGIPAAEVANSIGRHAAISAYIATERARAASWDDRAADYCDSITRMSESTVSEYEVKPGDILSRIVRERFEIAYDRLWPIIRALNPSLVNPDRIFPGQKIRLPALDIPDTED